MSFSVGILRASKFSVQGGVFAATLIAGIVVVDPAALNPYALAKLACLALGTAVLSVNVMRTATPDKQVPAVFLPIVTILIIALVSALRSPDRAVAWLGEPDLHANGLAQMCIYAALLLISFQERGEVKGHLLQWVLAAATGIIGVSVIFQKMTGFVAPGLPAAVLESGRAIGLAGSPVFLGAICAVSSPFLFDCFLRTRGSWRVAAGGAFALMISALLLSGSRGGLLAFGVGGAVFFALRGGRSVRRSFLILGTFFFVCGGLGGALIVRTTQASDAGRLALWKTTLRAIGEKPLLGMGPGAFETGIARFVNDEWLSAYGRHHTQAHAHNEPLNILASLGMVGAAAWIWFFVVLLHGIRRNFSASKDAASVASLAAAFVQAFVNPLPAPVWAVTAVVAGLLAAEAKGTPRRGVQVAAAFFACASAAAFISFCFAASADRAYSRARRAINRSEIKSSIHDYEIVSSRAPWRAKARREYIRVLLAIAKTETTLEGRKRYLRWAVREAKAAVAARPASGYPHQALGVALRSARLAGAQVDMEEIRTAFEEAVRLDPVHGGILESLLHFESALGNRSAVSKLEIQYKSVLETKH